MSKIKIVILLFSSLVTAEALAIDSDGEDLTMMSTPSPTTLTCTGLLPGQIDRMDDNDDDPLFQVPQVNDQETVTNGIGVSSRNGGYFGSCATYTSIARVVAILKNENLPIPPDFQVTEENIKRFF